MERETPCEITYERRSEGLQHLQVDHVLSVPYKVLNRILLERMRSAVDNLLQDEQAGFHKNRSCADHIVTLRITIEQSLEWNSPLCINLIDYEKAFDNVHRKALWKLLHHYDILEKTITIIQKMYEGISCRVVHCGQLSTGFEVGNGVASETRLLVITFDVMKATTKEKS